MRFLIILLLFIPNIFASFVFTPNDQRLYVPGDFIGGILKFDPKFEAEVSKLKGQNFLGNFYVFELKISGSGQADITLVPLGHIDTQKNLDWAGRQVDISALRLGQSKLSPKAYVIFEHALRRSFMERFWPLLAIVFLLAMIGLFWWKIWKNKMSLRALIMGKEKKIVFWKEKISKASKRDDFEMIYNKRKEWMTFLELDNLKTRDFFEMLNKHQYKKEWNEFELKEVEDSYLRFKNGI